MSFLRLPALAAHEVHVWRFGHTAPSAIQRDTGRILSPDERQRAESFRFERDRSRFVVCRAVLRTVLGGYSGVPPQDVALEYGPNGKPRLAGGGADGPGLSFNLSHSDSSALLAVAVGCAVGVDVERVRPGLAVGELARYSLSLGEQAELQPLSGRRRVIQFLTYWTRKEAYVKARGEGLGLELQQLDLRQPGACGVFPHVVPHDARWPDAAARWCVRDLPLGPDDVAAVAASSHGWQLRSFSFPQGWEQVAPWACTG